MKIDNNTIKHIADLSMINLSEDEEVKYAKSLEQILTYTEILNSLNFDGIENDDAIPKTVNRFRDDSIIEFSDKKSLLSNAPESFDNMFRIPKTY